MQLTGLLTILTALLLVGGGLWFAYWKYRSVLRRAKEIERGLKMVPMIIHLPPSSDDTEVGGRDVRDVIDEKISQAETLYNVIASTAKKGFKSKFYGQRHLSFELVSYNGTVQFYVAVPVVLESVVKQAILSAYPTAQLEEIEEHNIFNPQSKISGTAGGELSLKKEYAYPIATFKETKQDVMQSLLNALSSLGEGDGAALQILLRPAQDDWDKQAHSVVSSKRKNKGKKGGLKSLLSFTEVAQALWRPPEPGESKPEDKQLTSLEQSTLDAIEQKTQSAGYEVLIRVVTSSTSNQRANSILHNIIATFSLFNAQGLNGFTFSEAKDMEKFVTGFIFRVFPPEVNTNILNSVELATLFHLPDSRFSPTSQLQRQASKQVDGPHNAPRQGLLLGYNIFRGVKKEIRLSDDDRRRHMYTIGQTGTGKTSFLENLALQDMLNGNGFAFIDPHGDAVENLIAMVPAERTEDVIYFNPGEMDRPLGLNMFEFHSDDQKDFLIQEAMSMLYKLYDPQHQGIIGPRYEHMFRNAALLLMSDPNGSTFIDIPKLFRDDAYVRQKLKHVTDQTVYEFWTKEIPASRRSNDFGEVTSWFVSKFGAFLSNQMMRNIIGQTKSSFNLRDIMDNKKILLVNLSKGKLGEMNSQLLGMIFVMKFQAAAMSRADVPHDQRVDFSLYVDEFQNFSTDSFATILSEARKYRLNLIVANQFIGQLSEEIRDAVFGNVGTIASLRAGATDAEFLVKQFSPVFDAQDIVKLPNYNAIVSLMIGGVPSQPFSMATIPPLGNPNEELGIALKQLSASKYGRARSEVEKEIFDRMKTLPPTLGSTGAKPGGASGAPRPGVTPARPAAPAGGGSFLDEWLEKRRKQAASRPSVKPSQTGRTTQPTIRQPTTPTTPTKPPVKPDELNPNQTTRHDSGHISLNASDRSEQDSQQESDASSNDQVSVGSTPLMQHTKRIDPGTDSSDIQEQDSGSRPDTVEDVDKVAEILKQRLNKDQATETPKESTESNQIKDATESQPQPQSNPPVTPPTTNELPEGEIYIDKDGNLISNN